MREGHPPLAVCLCRKFTPKCGSLKHHLRLVSRCLRLRSGEQLSCVGLAGVVSQEVLSGVGEGLPGGTSHGCWQKAWVPCLMGPRAAWVPHHMVPPRGGVGDPARGGTAIPSANAPP